MTTVTAAIIICSNKILITRRAQGKYLAGYWEFPGGKLNDGETQKECLTREIKEELDICVEPHTFFMENTHHYSDRTILLKAYLCKYVSGDITLKDHDQMAWVSIHELSNYKFSPADIPFISSLKKHLP